MKLRPLLVPAIVLTATGGVVGWLLLAAPPEIPERETVVAASDGPATSTSGLRSRLESGGEMASAEIKPAPSAPLPDNIRNVSPDGVTAPRVSGRLKRIEPSKRYLELKNPPVEPIPDGPLELMRVQVLDGGHIQSGKLVVTLAHIEPLKRDETCVSRLGGQWPCGNRARTFLRGLIRQFRVTCEKIEELGPQAILATCNRGKFDLSARLVRYGWATPSADAPAHFADLANKAKEKKIGKWQSEWLKELPATNWSDEAVTALPGLEELTPEIVEWSLQSEVTVESSDNSDDQDR